MKSIENYKNLSVKLNLVDEFNELIGWVMNDLKGYECRDYIENFMDWVMFENEEEEEMYKRCEKMYGENVDEFYNDILDYCMNEMGVEWNEMISEERED